MQRNKEFGAFYYEAVKSLLCANSVCRLNEKFLWYVHWGLEHVVGHHRRVATPEDPATERPGESFYAFWPRTVFGGFDSAWEFEAGRMKKHNKPVWSLSNPMAVALFAQAVYIIFIAAIFGVMAKNHGSAGSQIQTSSKRLTQL